MQNKNLIESINDVAKGDFKDNIFKLEKFLLASDNVSVGDTVECPVKHSFSDGLYVREIFIPAGTVLTGKIHKHEHPNFLMSGEVQVVTESAGVEKLKGPVSIMSPAGTKRALHAITDLVWITVHHNPSNTNNLELLEEEVIADSFEDYNFYLESKSKKELQSNSEINISNGFFKNLINRVRLCLG